jgi:hypothetical protein
MHSTSAPFAQRRFSSTSKALAATRLVCAFVAVRQSLVANLSERSSEHRDAVEMTLFDASFDVKALAAEQMPALAVSCAESEFPVRRQGAYVRPLPGESDARSSRDGDVGARSVAAWRADACAVAGGGRGAGAGGRARCRTCFNLTYASRVLNKHNRPKLQAIRLSNSNQACTSTQSNAYKRVLPQRHSNNSTASASLTSASQSRSRTIALKAALIGSEHRQWHC